MHEGDTDITVTIPGTIRGAMFRAAEAHAEMLADEAAKILAGDARAEADLAAHPDDIFLPMFDHRQADPRPAAEKVSDLFLAWREASKLAAVLFGHRAAEAPSAKDWSDAIQRAVAWRAP